MGEVTSRQVCRWLTPWLAATLVLGLPGPARGGSDWVRFDNPHSLQFGQSTDVWTNGATMMDLEYTTPDGATFVVFQNGKAFPPSYGAGASRGEVRQVTFRVPPTDTPARLGVQWDFPTTPQRFTILVTSFSTLNITAVWLNGTDPQVTGPSAKPVLVTLGDSITHGEFSGGPQANSSGYADWITDRWNVRNWAVPGSSATCTGQYMIDDIAADRPAAVLVAYGTNDITGDYSGCRGTRDDFRAAMSSIAAQLRTDMPQARVYLAAILPRYDGPGKSVPEWNTVLHEVADQHSVPFVDTTAVLTQADFFDGLHPSAPGHVKLARFWHAVFADSAAPTATSVSISPRPFSPSLGLSVKWNSTDVGTGVQGYDVRYRKAPYNGDFGPWVRWRDRTRSTGGGLQALAGRTYCFSGMAFDRAGNASAWGPHTCVATPLDDRSLERRGGWVAGAGDGYFLGTFVRGTADGASLRLRGVRGRRIAILAKTCPACGSVTILWNGRAVGHVDLTSATTIRSAIIPVMKRTSDSAGTLAIRMASTRPVTLDGVAVLH